MTDTELVSCVTCTEEFVRSDTLIHEAGHVCLACAADADADEALAASQPSWTRALHFVPGYALLAVATLVLSTVGSNGKAGAVAFLATLIGMGLSMVVAAEGAAGLTRTPIQDEDGELSMSSRARWIDLWLVVSGVLPILATIYALL